MQYYLVISTITILLLEMISSGIRGNEHIQINIKMR